ncbi:MAG: hypothetical protein PHT95_02105, partial [Candidatus Omnitrophica bacterium]|nr:hypothetical protein [Candidatus Omnitrophota bacterium]
MNKLRSIAAGILTLMLVPVSGFSDEPPARPCEITAPHGIPPEPAASEKSKAPKKRTFLQFLGKVDDLGDAVTGPFNSNGNLGKMKGKVQSLTMRQSTDSYNRDGSVKDTKTVTSTMAFFLDYV